MATGRSPQNPTPPVPPAACPPVPGPSPANPAALLKAHEYAEKRDWPKYFQAVAGKGPRETLLKALELVDKEGAGAPRLAVDLGCGSGRDTLELLRRGWNVLAIDGHPQAIDLLQAQVPVDQRARLECRVARFEEAEIPPAQLINSSYSLPFCDPAQFGALWGRIVGAIPAGGRFAGQLFGDRDDWAKLPDRSHQTRPQMERLLADFLIEQLNEAENREPTSTGEIKDWHIFHIVARKRR